MQRMTCLGLLLLVVVSGLGVAAPADIDERSTTSIGDDGPRPSLGWGQSASLPADVEWNLTVVREDRTVSPLGEVGSVAFYLHAKETDDGVYVPSIAVVRTDGSEGRLVANLAMSRQAAGPGVRENLSAAVVGDSLLAVYRGKVLSVSGSGGDWRLQEHEPLDAPLVDVVRRESAATLVTRRGARRYEDRGDRVAMTGSYRTEDPVAAVARGTESLVLVTEHWTEGDGCPGGGDGCIGGGPELVESRVLGLAPLLEERWRQSYGEGEAVVIAHTGSHLFVTTSTTPAVSWYDPRSGDRLGSWTHPGTADVVFERHGPVVYVRPRYGSGTVYVLDAETGERRWQYNLSNTEFRGVDRLLTYRNGTYVLRNATTGERLGRYAGPNSRAALDRAWRWNEVKLLGTDLLAMTTVPEPTRLYVDAETGEVVTRLEFGEEVTERYADDRSLHPTSGTLGGDGGIYVRVVRGDLAKVYVYPGNGRWLTFDADVSEERNEYIQAPVARVGQHLLYVRAEWVDEGRVVDDRLETLHVRSLNGTYLGRARVFRADVGAPIEQTVPYPFLSIRNQNNDNFTAASYAIELAHENGTTYLRYAEPDRPIVDKDGVVVDTEPGDVYRFRITGLAAPTSPNGAIGPTPAPGAMVEATLVCGNALTDFDGAALLLSNPTSVAVTFAVDRVQQEHRVVYQEFVVQLSSNRLVPIADDGVTSIQARTNAGDELPVRVEIRADSKGSIPKDGAVRPDCASGGTPNPTSTAQPGFTLVTTLLALLAVVVIGRRGR